MCRQQWQRLSTSVPKSSACCGWRARWGLSQQKRDDGWDGVVGGGQRGKEGPNNGRTCRWGGGGVDALLNKKPVEVLDNGVMCYQERVWVRRQAAEFWMRESCWSNSRSDEGIYEYFSCVMGEGWLKTCNVAELKERCFSGIVNVLLAREGRVHFNAVVVYSGRGSDLTSINEERRRNLDGTMRNSVILLLSFGKVCPSRF